MARSRLSGRCDNCPLNMQGPPVNGEGDGERVILVGQAPGVQERTQRRPYVGKLSQPLRSALNNLGWTREEVRITNLVKCVPPDNRDPLPSEIQACLPHLEAEIKEGATVVLMGNQAIKALTSTREGVTKCRGSWTKLNGELTLGNDVLLTLHPAYIARSHGEAYYDRWIRDLRTAYAGPVQRIGTFGDLMHKVDDVIEWFAEIPDGTIVSWHIEVSADRFYDGEILALAFSYQEGESCVIGRTIDNPDALKSFLSGVFRSDRVKWVSGKQQQAWMWHTYGTYPIMFADTELMHLALDENRSAHDMSSLARDLLDAPDWDARIRRHLRTKSASRDTVTSGIILQSAAEAADYTRQLYFLFRDLMKEDGVEELHDNFLLIASELLTQMEYFGIRVNRETIAGWDEELSGQLAEVRDQVNRDVKLLVTQRIEEVLEDYNIDPERFWTIEIPKGFKVAWNKEANTYKVTDTRANELYRQMECPYEVAERIIAWRVQLINREYLPGSWQQFGTVLYDILQMPMPVDIFGREFFTTERKHVESDEEVVAMTYGVRSLTKLRSTYVVGLRPDSNSRVHPDWDITAAVTGRLGCRDPNMMNIPVEAGVRNIFEAREGCSLIEVDYRQAELRVTGAYAAMDLPREDALKTFFVETYREGKDIHSETMHILFDADFIADRPYLARTRAKNWNFGLLYGQSIKAIAAMYGITEDEARVMHAAYFGRMPEVQELLSGLESAVVDPGYVQTIYGRKRRFPLVTDSNLRELQRQSKNYLIQSTATDITLEATYRVQSWLLSDEFPDLGAAVLFLHDELMVEVPDEHVPVAARKIYDIMLQVPQDRLGDLIPFDVDAKVGKVWGELQPYDAMRGEYL